MNVSPKMIFAFYSEPLIPRLLKVRPGCMPCAPPNLPLIKWREAYWCFFSILVFLLVLC